MTRNVPKLTVRQELNPVKIKRAVSTGTASTVSKLKQKLKGKQMRRNQQMKKRKSVKTAVVIQKPEAQRSLKVKRAVAKGTAFKLKKKPTPKLKKKLSPKLKKKLTPKQKRQRKVTVFVKRQPLSKLRRQPSSVASEEPAAFIAELSAFSQAWPAVCSQAEQAAFSQAETAVFSQSKKRQRSVKHTCRDSTPHKSRTMGVQAPSTFILVRYTNREGISYDMVGASRVQKMTILSLPTNTDQGRGQLIEDGFVLNFGFDNPPVDPTVMCCNDENGLFFILKPLEEAGRSVGLTMSIPDIPKMECVYHSDSQDAASDSQLARPKAEYELS